MGKKPDFFQVAVRVGQQATRTAPPDEPKALPPKAAAGRKGGLKGGKARPRSSPQRSGAKLPGRRLGPDGSTQSRDRSP